MSASTLHRSKTAAACQPTPRTQSHTRRRWAALLAVALVWCATVTALAIPASAGAATNTLFGFNNYNAPSNYGLQPQLGMPVRRMMLGWNTVQPAPGQWNWQQSDAVYAGLLGHGLKPLIVVQSAPCWANEAVSCKLATSGALPPDALHYSAWAQFMAALTKRYPKAIGIEIWNEENLTGEWLPYPSPAAYAAVLKTAYSAIKRVNRSMPVISGGLFVGGQSGPQQGPYGIATRAFLAGMYAHGVKGHFNGIGIHPYPIAGGWDGTPVRVDTGVMEQSLNLVRAVRNAAGDRSTPLWITEMGVSTQPVLGSAPAATPLKQASDLLALVSRAKADSDVRVALIHRLADQSVAPAVIAGGYGGYGVFNPNGTPKQAACQLSLFFRGSLHCSGAKLMTSALYVAKAVRR